MKHAFAQVDCRNRSLAWIAMTTDRNHVTSLDVIISCLFLEIATRKNMFHINIDFLKKGRRKYIF